MNENTLEHGSVPAQEEMAPKKEPAEEHPLATLPETLSQIKDIENTEEAPPGEEGGTAEMGKRINADHSEINAANEAVHFEKRSTELGEKRRELWNNLKEKISTALLPIVTALAMSGDAEFQGEMSFAETLAKGEVPTKVVKAEARELVPEDIFDKNSPLALSSEMKKKVDRPMTAEETDTLEDMYAKAWREKIEWISLSGYKDGEYVNQTKPSGSMGGYTEMEIGDEMKNEALTHTHPVEASGNAKLIREGKLKAFIMPPSTVDIGQCMSDASRNTLQRVVDPRGVWEYQCDENHPFAKSQRKMGENLVKAIEAIKIKYNVDKADLQNAFASSQDSHPNYIISQVFGKLESKYPGIIVSSQDSFAELIMKTNNTSGLSLLEYESNGTSLYYDSPKLSDEENAKKIMAIIKNAETIGVNLSYTPFKQSPKREMAKEAPTIEAVKDTEAGER